MYDAISFYPQSPTRAVCLFLAFITQQIWRKNSVKICDIYSFCDQTELGLVVS